MPQRASLHCLIAASLLPRRNPNVHWGPDAYLTLLENQLLELSLSLCSVYSKSKIAVKPWNKWKQDSMAFRHYALQVTIPLGEGAVSQEQRINHISSNFLKSYRCLYDMAQVATLGSDSFFRLRRGPRAERVLLLTYRSPGQDLYLSNPDFPLTV